MNRTAYLCTALVFGLVGLFWSFGFTALYIGNGLSKDSVPGASFYDAGFIFMLAIWGGIFLGIIWGAWACLKRAFRPTRKDAINSLSETIQPSKESKFATPDEKLAHLVKKP